MRYIYIDIDIYICIYVYICIFPIRIYLPTYPKMFNGFNEHILSGDLVCWIGLGDRLYFLGGMSQSVCSIPNANIGHNSHYNFVPQ